MCAGRWPSPTGHGYRTWHGVSAPSPRLPSGRLRPSEPAIGPAEGGTRWTGYGEGRDEGALFWQPGRPRPSARFEPAQALGNVSAFGPAPNGSRIVGTCRVIERPAAWKPARIAIDGGNSADLGQQHGIVLVLRSRPA